MKEVWRVYLCEPRADGKEGKNFTYKAEPPYSLSRLGVQPIRRTTGLPDRAEALAFCERVARDLNSSVLQGEDPSVVEVLAKHTDWRAAIDAPANTVQAYRQALRRLTPLMFDVRGEELTRARVIRTQDALRATLAPGTVNQTLNCARAAWAWAQEREWVSADWPRVRRLPVPETEKRPFSDAEVEAVLAWFSSYRGGYWLPLFTVLADSGARIGELLRMRGEQVDRAAGVLRLGRGKNGEARAPKLPHATMELVPQAAAGQLVFRPKRPGFHSDRPMSGRNTLGVLWRALEALGVQDADDLDQHSFRRSWISASVDERVPLTASMAVTGHRSTRVHLDYARRAERDMAAAVDTVRERRRRAGGARPWEQDPIAARHSSGSVSTGQHRTETGVGASPNSSGFPPGSPPPSSCWSRRVEPQGQVLHATAVAYTGQPRTPRVAERTPIASPFLDGHPLGERIGLLVGRDPEAWLATRAPEVEAALLDLLARKGLAVPAPVKKGARRAAH